MSGKDTRDAVEAAVNQPVAEWINDPDVQVEEGHSGTVVFSAQMPAAWSDQIAAETVRRGLDNPGELIRVLVREGLDRAWVAEAATNDEVIAAFAEVEAAVDNFTAKYRSHQANEQKQVDADT